MSDKRTRECALCPLPSGAQTKPHSSQKTENSFLPPDQEGAGTPNPGATTQWVRGDLRFESDIVSNRRPLGIVTQGIRYRRLVGWLQRIPIPSENEPKLSSSPPIRNDNNKTEPCFSWLNPGQIVIHRAAFGPLQPAVVGILSNDTPK